jgi:tRNA A37 threonylcarbamoyladenosine synthetase subunit TsaC/SUA5/YrdC
LSTSNNSDEVKARFREALAKKKSVVSKKGETAGEKSKIIDMDAHGNTPKMFRRKSGSA